MARGPLSPSLETGLIPMALNSLTIRQLTLALAIFGGQVAFAADPEIDFSRDILPLLSNNCFKCHGPDETNRASELRLDQQPSSLARLDSGHTAVVPGDSANSELFRRISSADPDVKMPPVDSMKPLTDKQVRLIQKWIDSGAKWSGHWSFRVPTRGKVPAPVGEWKANNAIDRFIHASLAQHNLVPEPSASKESLIRRVTLDLIGLPPTVQEIDDFLNDNSEQAYERVVDRLLKSARYGEHMARF